MGGAQTLDAKMHRSLILLGDAKYFQINWCSLLLTQKSLSVHMHWAESTKQHWGWEVNPELWVLSMEFVLHVTLPATRISRWLIDLWKICSPLYSLPRVLAQKQLPFTVKLFLIWILQWPSICAPVTAKAYTSTAYWAAVLLQHCN